MKDAIIRRATLGDAELLAVLNKDVQQIHADALPKLFKQPDNLVEVTADFQTRILADVDGLVFIAEADQQAVGYIYAKVVTRPENAYTFTQKLMLVDQISVRPSDQHKGYGQLLMQAVLDEASAQGVFRVVLDMYSFNSNAQHFYAKMGFERLSARMALDFN